MISRNSWPPKHWNRIWRFSLVAALFSLAFAIAGCKDSKTDVTNDNSHGNFSSVVGTWKTKAPLTLKEIDKKLYLDTWARPPNGRLRPISWRNRCSFNRRAQYW
jgi:hypothetical protein